MQNFNVLLLGMIGSGKSQFMRRMLKVTPRAVVLDRMGEYGDCGGVFTSYRESARFYLENRRRDFHIIFQGSNPESHTAWIDTLFRIQIGDKTLPPVGLFMDEGSLYSSTHNVESVVQNLYQRGRHSRISVATAAQGMSDIHPMVRALSHVWVTMRLRAAPVAIEKRFTRDDLQKMPFLQDLTPDQTPEYGKHFLTDAGDVDVIARWRRMVEGS